MAAEMERRAGALADREASSRALRSVPRSPFFLAILTLQSLAVLACSLALSLSPFLLGFSHIHGKTATTVCLPSLVAAMYTRARSPLPPRARSGGQSFACLHSCRIALSFTPAQPCLSLPSLVHICPVLRCPCLHPVVLIPCLDSMWAGRSGSLPCVRQTIRPGV